MAPRYGTGWQDGGRHGSRGAEAGREEPARAERAQGKMDPALRGHAERKDVAAATGTAGALAKAREQMAAAGLEALVVTHLPNVFYLCGFTGSNAALVVVPEAAHLFTDGRYTIQAREESPGARLHISRKPLTEESGAFLKALAKRGRLAAGYEPAHLSVAEWSKMEEAAGKKIAWKGASGMVEGLREVKSPEELEIMKEAAKLGSEVMDEAIALAQPGMSELDLAAEIDFRMRKKGATGPSFETIVASGARSALPHARPTAKRLDKNELVVLDLGVILRHYCSDLTRTVFIGRAPAKVRGWYKAVAAAQQEALEAVQEGVTAGAIDKAARQVLERQGLGPYFVHGTGHGLGIEIHEAPRVGRRQKQIIRAGNVITLEPGVYVEGVGGIRIEDDVAVSAGGTEVLTSARREFIEI